MRNPLIVGAQKLYLSLNDSIKFARDLATNLRDRSFPFDIAICPSFINLAHVANILKESQIGIGAQNVHQEDSGAFTGQVSIKELLQIGVKYITVGHSELRTYQGETNGDVNQKVKTCLKHGVIPIACVGEKKEERESGKSKEVIDQDIRGIFVNISPSYFKIEDVVIAYEPVWAIKAGKADKNTRAATAGEANEMHEFIRNIISTIYGNGIATKMRIIYGGSVSPENTKELLKEPSIDGLLVGTASIKVESFLKILGAAEETVSKIKSTVSIAFRN